ncbi:MAG: hypothetical protein F6K11_35695, partial [Leptolyngbya sp. SIO3F4]|nr:hypothetical protein [Leptolyngbya sp. SIO3F4]
MTAEISSSESKPVGAVGSEQRFIEKTEKYRGNEKPTFNPSAKAKHEEVRKGYFSRKLERFREKARANVEAAKSHAWSVISTNPFINTGKRRYIYKVRNGELSDFKIMKSIMIGVKIEEKNMCVMLRRKFCLIFVKSIPFRKSNRI